MQITICGGVNLDHVLAGVSVVYIGEICGTYAENTESSGQ